MTIRNPTWILAALVAVLASALLPAPASADRAFSTRFQTDAQGDITFAANTVVTCQGGGNGSNSCANSQAATGASQINNDWNMTNVDVDGDATTFNSSRATVTLPPGVSAGDVLFAGLYWGADTAAGAGGSAAVNAAAKDTVRFSRPGLAGYTTLTASQVDTSDTSVTRYQAFADVTAAVQAGGSGSYGVANVQAGLGNDRYGGWTLVIAYEDLTEPLRNLVVRDGLTYIVGGGSGAVPLEGFITPTSGLVKAKLGLMSWEGELGYTPETVTLNGTTITDAQNPANNVFNSSISLNGARFTNKTPNYVNQLGFDADIINIDGMLPNGATSADLNMSSDLETLIPAVTTLAIDQAPRRPIATPGAGPVISGTAQEGSTLSSTTGAFTGTKPFTYAYQWSRCDTAGANCVNIAGATNSTYSLVPADVGKTLRVLVNASNASGGDSAQSSQTATITARNPVSTVAPAITGTTQEASTLNADTGTWTGTAPISYAYQWLRCNASGAACASIASATSASYSLVPADGGSTVRVRVTATNVGGSSSAESAQSSAITARNPANTAAPSITGTPADGSTLTATNGTWTGTAPISFAYQWLRCDSAGANCTNISGATNQTYSVAPADLNATIRVRVTGTNVGGSSSAQSAQTSAVTGSVPVNTAIPSISGTVQEGSSLTASPGTWTGTAPISFAYQWLRCDSAGANCSNIASATGQSYALVPADVASTIRVRVTGTNAVGSSFAQSNRTAAVPARAPANTGAPSVTGTTQEGSTLSAVNGTWTGTAPISFSYQWLRCDSGGAGCSDIGGATSASYALVPADVGSTIRVRVTGSNASGTPTPAQSGQTAAITGRAPMNTVAPAVTGNASDGSTLTATNGTWTGTAPISFAYQWLRCDSAGANCTNISGATSANYSLSSADVGGTVRIRVTGTNVTAATPAQSAPSATVTATSPSSGSGPAGTPSISGTAQEGSTLTAANGTWNGTTPMSFSHQWLRCDSSGAGCSAIGGATNNTYSLVPADVGSTIRVRVTATNSAGSSQAESAQTSTVTGRAPVSTGAPTISGTAQEGSTLTAGNGTWTGTAPIAFSHQWLRCDGSGANCSSIGGATGNTYALVPADVGSTIRVRVTGTNVAGNSSAQSGQTASVTGRAPANTQPPSASGVTQEGSTLTAGNGTWTGTAPISFNHQWLRCDASGAGCSPIGGATGTTYSLVPADIGSAIRVRVTATNVAGASNAESGATAPVTGRAPANTQLPSVSGTAQEGSTLTATNGTWTGTAPISFAYQWLRCDGSGCSNVAGATGQSYSLAPADVGSTIRVRVTATNVAGDSSAQSSQSTAVTARAPVNTAPPTVSGSPEEGSTLSVAGNGTWTGTAPISFSYQWLRCDGSGSACSSIPGAVGDSYGLAPADVASTIRVRVTAANASGSPVSAQSAQTQPISARAPVNTGLPQVAGEAADGETLTATNGTWTGTAPISFAYQWLRCDSAGANCTNISGATNQSYTLVPADVGSTIRARVSASNGSGSPVAAASDQTEQVAAAEPANSSAPSITGTPKSGETLTADPGSWTGTGPFGFTYRWERCVAADCTPVPGATSETYDLTAADVGREVRVLVTASNSAGSASAPSGRVGPVAAELPANSTPPSITGTTRDGETLTADPGTWTGTGPFDFTYQWLRCDGSDCAAIPGATGPTYELTGADVGHEVEVAVTAANAAGNATRSSDPVGPVAAEQPSGTTAPSISGTPRDGETLTADPGAWSGTGPFEFSYQWERCDAGDCVAIPGATGPTLDLGGADVGSDIRVSVKAANATGDATEISDPVGPVAARQPSSTEAPSIDGTPRDGETLTADPGTWGGTGPFGFSYQWQRCDAQGDGCSDIPGATGSTYTAGPDDAGDTIRVVVTASNAAGQQSAGSDPAGPVAARLPSNSVLPSITGAPRDGETLSANPGTWDGTPQISFTFQWLRCDGSDCEAISGATGEDYSVSSGDVGLEVRVAVTATNAAGSATEDSEPVGPATARGPVNVQAPTITGVPEDGGALTADPGTWNGTGPFNFVYQWQRCDAQGADCVDIDGATGQAYAPAADDVGGTIRVVVTAGNGGGSQSAASQLVGPVAAAAPSNATPPSISGTPADEQTLTADPGTWNGTGPFDFTYQWLRCDGSDCAPIPGADAATLKLTDADVGHEIRVAVTASNAAGDAAQASAAVGPVTAAGPGNTTVPTIGGTPRDGETLTADPGAWEGTGPFTHAYQWQRCDTTGCTDIDGATGAEYELTDADVGFDVRVVVTTNGPGGSMVKTSEALGPVEPQAPLNTQVPVISGSPRDGATLTSTAGVWSGTGQVDLAYQWMRCNGNNCVAMPNATGASLKLTAADVGRHMLLRVSATNGGGTTSRDSNRIGPVMAEPPAATGAPVIGGDPRDGGTLTADPGTWTGTGPINHTYQWVRCAGGRCEPIPGATGDTYSPGPGDVGKDIRVDVTATGPGGSVTQRSGPAGPVSATAPANLDVPTYSGALATGSELVASPGTWSGTGPLELTYQWLRCDSSGANCAEIPEATGETYVVSTDDVGSMISLRVVATNSAGSAEALAAAAGPVAPLATNPDEDLSEIPDSLVSPDRCQQAPRPVAAAVAVRGIGRMRFRVAATDGVITPQTPLLAASTKTRVRRGALARLVRAVIYRLDRRRFKVVRRAPYTVSIPPRLLAGSPRHTLTATTLARSGARSTVNIPFRTSPCTALFTANHRVIGKRGGLRLRVDTKHAIRELAFRLPTALMPRVRRRTSSGKLQLYLGGGNRPVYRLTFGTRLSRSGTVLARAGAPRVVIRGRRVEVRSLPSGVGIVKLQLVKRGPAVRRLRVRTTLYAQVITAHGKQLLRTRIGPLRRR